MNNELTKISREVEHQIDRHMKTQKYTMSKTDLDKLNYINMHKKPIGNCDDEFSDFAIFAGAFLLFGLACTALFFFFTL